MADNNRYRGNRPYQSGQDWNEGENRFHYDNDADRGRENYESYGNASFGNDYNQNYNQRRVNYIPDNNDNRQEYGSSRDSGQHGDTYSTDYGYGNSGSYRRQQIGDNSRHQWGSQWGNHYGASHRPDYGSYDQDNDRSYQQNRGENYNAGNQMGYGNQMRNQPYDRSGYGDRSYREQDQHPGNQNAWKRARNEASSWFSDDDDNRGRNVNRPTESHRGKGPRNYQRSDERIREDVCDRLADDDMLDASDIEVNVNGSEVVLTGTVLSREAKRHAEDLAESISGVRHVENRIRVGRLDELDGNYTTSQVIRAVQNKEDRNL